MYLIAAILAILVVKVAVAIAAVAMLGVSHGNMN